MIDVYAAADRAEVNTGWLSRRDGRAGDIGVGRPFCPAVIHSTASTKHFTAAARVNRFSYCNRLNNFSTMLNALSRAALGALKAGKSNLTPKIVHNELPKAMVATTSTCKYRTWCTSRRIFSATLVSVLLLIRRDDCVAAWPQFGAIFENQFKLRSFCSVPFLVGFVRRYAMYNGPSAAPVLFLYGAIGTWVNFTRLDGRKCHFLQTWDIVFLIFRWDVHWIIIRINSSNDLFSTLDGFLWKFDNWSILFS